jgi:hypothetical protein
MSVFEYILFIPGIVIGLAMANVLTGVGRVIHRLAGHGPPIRLSGAHIGWVCGALQWIITAWWYSYNWTEANEVTFAAFLFLIFYAIGIFVMCAILVPIDMDEVSDFGDYFLSMRKWFYGSYLLMILIDFADSLAKGLDNLLQLGPGYLSLRSVLLIGVIIGMRTENRLYHLVLAWGTLGWGGIFFWVNRPTL